MTTRPEYVEVQPNVRLHVRDWGNGKPVVLVHGWPLSNAMYDYQMTELARKGFRAISVSLRGYGKSNQPWGPYTYDVFADDLKTVLDTLQVDGATLGGFSMGGAIVIRYVVRHQSARVAKLALFGAAAPSWTRRADYPHGHDRTMADAILRTLDVDRPRQFREFGKIFGKSETSISEGHAQWLYDVSMQASPYAVAESVVALRDTDLRADLGWIAVPTAVFHGLHDMICPFSFAEQMVQGIKNAVLVPFENSGHGLFLEEKEKFNEELLKLAK